MRDLLRISEYLSEEWGVFNDITCIPETPNKGSLGFIS